MGIKFLNIQMIQWWNHIPCMHIRPETGTIKLIKSDGHVKIYDRPVHVSEVLDDHPKHMVCRSDCFYIGQKIPALAVDDQLQPGHKYFLLPNHCFQSVLSFLNIASFVSTSRPQHMDGRDQTCALLKKAATCQAFDIQKSPTGCLRVRVSDEFIAQLIEEGKMEGASQLDDLATSGKLCNTPQLKKDYGLLVRSRQWKPKLETIREKNKKIRISSSFGMKRTKKKSPSSSAPAEGTEKGEIGIKLSEKSTSKKPSKPPKSTEKPTSSKPSKTTKSSEKTTSSKSSSKPTKSSEKTAPSKASSKSKPNKSSEIPSTKPSSKLKSKIKIKLKLRK